MPLMKQFGPQFLLSKTSLVLVNVLILKLTAKLPDSVRLTACGEHSLLTAL